MWCLTYTGRGRTPNTIQVCSTYPLTIARVLSAVEAFNDKTIGPGDLPYKLVMERKDAQHVFRDLAKVLSPNDYNPLGDLRWSLPCAYLGIYWKVGRVTIV